MKRFVFLLLVSSTSFFAQTKMSVESLFEKIDEYYGKNKDYSYSSEYFVYESELSNKIIDHYSGLAIKKGNVNYQKTNKAEFINFTDYSVSINHTEMKILITKNTIKNSIQSLKELLKICNKNKLTEDKLYWICELWSDKKNYKKQFEKIEIYINKNDFSLHRQLFYTTGSQEVFKNNKKKILKNPRLEILFKKNSIKVIDDKILSKENYFRIENKKFIVAKRFKAYNLITL